MPLYTHPEKFYRHPLAQSSWHKNWTVTVLEEQSGEGERHADDMMNSVMGVSAERGHRSLLGFPEKASLVWPWGTGRMWCERTGGTYESGKKTLWAEAANAWREDGGGRSAGGEAPVPLGLSAFQWNVLAATFFPALSSAPGCCWDWNSQMTGSPQSNEGDWPEQGVGSEMQAHYPVQEQSREPGSPLGQGWP